MAPKPKTGIEPGMVPVVSFGVLFLVNALVIALANAFFPTQVVVGTNAISPLWSVIHSMVLLTLLDVFAIPFLHRYERNRKKELTPKDWMIAYLVLNFVGIWIITRFSDQIGLGISGWWVALLLALVLDALQGFVMMQLDTNRATS
jgi:hypothetical protein